MSTQPLQHPDDDTITVTVRIKTPTLTALDQLRQALGLESRGEVVSQILDELLQACGPDPTEGAVADQPAIGSIASQAGPEDQAL